MSEPVAEEMTSTDVNMLLAGLALLVLAVLAWTGVWKWWARLPSFRPFPITWGLTMGLWCVLGSLQHLMSRDMFGFLGLLLFLVSILLIFCFFKDPQWFRPKWYKGWDDRNIDPNFWGYADLAGMPATLDQDSELAARNAHISEEVLERRGMCRLVGEEWGRPTKQHMNGVVEGAFLFYPSVLVFCADSSDDNLRGGPTVREVAASQIRGVEATVPDAADRARGLLRIRFGQVLLHTESGEPWRIEVLRRQRFIDDVHRFYLDPQGGSGGRNADHGHRP